MKITKVILERIIEEEVKSYIGGVKASSRGGANLGLDHSTEKPSADEYSKVDKYLAQRSARFMGKILKKINREFGKVDQRLDKAEKTIGILISNSSEDLPEPRGAVGHSGGLKERKVNISITKTLINEVGPANKLESGLGGYSSPRAVAVKGPEGDPPYHRGGFRDRNVARDGSGGVDPNGVEYANSTPSSSFYALLGQYMAMHALDFGVHSQFYLSHPGELSARLAAIDLLSSTAAIAKIISKMEDLWERLDKVFENIAEPSEKKKAGAVIETHFEFVKKLALRTLNSAELKAGGYNREVGQTANQMVTVFDDYINQRGTAGSQVNKVFEFYIKAGTQWLKSNGFDSLSGRMFSPGAQWKTPQQRAKWAKKVSKAKERYDAHPGNKDDKQDAFKRAMKAPIDVDE